MSYMDNYMDILKRVNAYRRNYDPNEQVIGNSSAKYVSIISPYLQKAGITKTKKIVPTKSILRPLPPYRQTRLLRKQGGNILLKSRKNNENVIFWDEINGLVDRIRLLMPSLIAGKTGHENDSITSLHHCRNVYYCLSTIIHRKYADQQSCSALFK